MNVLSLFDGMSCGMIALDRLGIKVDNYYASEIDKYAIQVSQANYPDIIQVGDITKLDLSTLPKIDLVMGGSPCQGFSFAGKQLAFDDPRSALFFEFHKAISYLQPKYFLLENVRMKKEYLDIISEYMGVEPIFINSSLVSAQSRQRYYWTNIPGIEQPKERGIVLRDILEDQVGSEHYVGDNMQKNYKGGNQLNPNYKSQANTIHNSDKKSGTICAGTHGYANGYVGDKHKPVKQTERNARHLKQLDDKSLCMTASMYKGAGNNGMTLVPQKLVDDTSDLPEKSQTIKSQYYKSSKANFEREGTFHATGIPQKLVSDKPQRVGTHVEEVKVRKHEVDITALQYLLREMKAESKKTNRQIAEETNLPITKVEHWFRTDSSFAIPSDDVWLKLKEVLGIQTEVFDKPIMEFEYRDGVYESTQRVYGDHGKSPTLTASNSDQLIQTSDKPQHIGTAVDVNGHDILKRVYSPNGKSPTVNTMGGGNREPKVVAGAWRGRSLNEDGKNVKWKDTKPKQILETRKDEKSNTVSTFTKDNLVVQSYREVRTEEAKKARRENRQKTGKDHTPFRAKELQPRDDGKVGTVTPSLNNDHKISLTKDNDQEVYWRKLTPLECERLQTVPDNYTNHVSNTQRYKMLGNGWTIEVIAHILQNMEIDNV
jgi:DNA-cytosine methyltransferase